MWIIDESNFDKNHIKEIEAIAQIGELSYLDITSADIIEALEIVESNFGSKYNTVLLTQELLSNYDNGDDKYVNGVWDVDYEYTYTEVLEESCEYILNNMDSVDLSVYEVDNMQWYKVREDEMNRILFQLKRYPELKSARLNDKCTAIKVYDSYHGSYRSICWCTHEGFKVSKKYKRYFDSNGNVKPHKDTYYTRDRVDELVTENTQLKARNEVLEAEMKRFSKELSKIESVLLGDLYE